MNVTANYDQNQVEEITELRSNSIIHFEQSVNDRLGTSPAPALAEELLPETRKWQPMIWARVPKSTVDLFCDENSECDSLADAISSGDSAVIFPIHPLLKHKYSPQSLIFRGQMAISASYRTVFFEPDENDPLSSLIPQGHVMMIKLHLDDPLPGIVGDRRLTPSKVRKCIELSAILRSIFDKDCAGNRQVSVLRERFGLVHKDRGALFRFVPRHEIMPVFSLYSRDLTRNSRPPILIQKLRQFGWSADEVAHGLADWLAQPLISAFLAAFQQGFSLEMHAQNTLISFDPDEKIERMFFRDLESVIFFPEIRESQKLEPLELSHLGPELYQEPRSPTRWFNRNLDHDIGRIFESALDVLEREGVFDRKLRRLATRQIRTKARTLIDEYGLNSVARQGRWLRYSRTPYGRGLRRFRFYRSRYR